MGIRLPAEYQEVEYIQSTATQWLDTGVKPKDNSNFKISFRARRVSNPGGQGNYIYGTSGNWCSMEYYNSSLNWNTGSTTHAVLITAPAINKDFDLDIDYSGNVMTISGFYNGSVQYSGTLGSGNLVFFAKSANTNMYPLRLYNLKIRQGDNYPLIRDFVPCYRKSDNKPGMYDFVSGTFYTNQGTGEFTVGPDIHRTISPRLMDRRRALIAKLTSLFRKVITSQTGLVSFDTNIAKPMKVTCEFSPKQDLHGYDHPWPGGGGKNLFNKNDISDTNRYINSAGNSITPSSGEWRVSNYIPVTAGQTYTISGMQNTGTTSPAVCFYDENYNHISGRAYSSDLVKTVTAVNGSVWARLSVAFSKINECQFELGSTATAYEPYENICPIEGWDGANVVNAGDNILNTDNIIFKMFSYFTSPATFSNGVLTMSVNEGTCVLLYPVKGNTSYRIGATKESGGNVYWAIYEYSDIPINKDDYLLNSPSTSGLTANNYIDVTTLSATKYIGLYFQHGQGSSGTVVDNFWISTSSLTQYVQHVGNTLPIPFNNPGTYDFLPVQAGTGDPSPENVRPITPGLTFTRDDTSTLSVYSGTLTVNEDGSGTLVADVIGKRVTSDLGTINFSVDRVRYTVMDMLPVDAVTMISNQRYLCNIFPKVYGSTAPGIMFTQNGDGTSPFILFRGLDSFGITNTLEGWNQFITDNEVFITYVLSTPTTYTLSVAETGRAFEALGLGKNLGPLYSGTVTINEDGSADVYSDFWFQEFTGEENWYDNTVSGHKKYFLAQTIPVQPVGGIVIDVKSAIAKYDASLGSGFNIPGYCMAYGFIAAPGWVGYCFDANDVPTVNDFKALLADLYAKGTPEQFYAKLRTTQTYHLDNIGQLQSFLGTNNVWSDLNGPITVEYYKKQQ